jgi:hypothetical protein
MIRLYIQVASQLYCILLSGMDGHDVHVWCTCMIYAGYVYDVHVYDLYIMYFKFYDVRYGYNDKCMGEAWTGMIDVHVWCTYTYVYDLRIWCKCMIWCTGMIDVHVWCTYTYVYDLRIWCKCMIWCTCMM